MTKYDVIYSDVGGTNVRFALHGEERHSPVRKFTREEVVLPAYEDYLERYLKENPQSHPQMMIIGTAGNVKNGKVLSASNLKMTPPDAAAIQARFPGIQRVKIVNDFTLQAMAIPTLSEDQYVSLTPNAKPSADGRKLVIGPGSGLGTGLVYLDEESNTWKVMDSEAGQNFVPLIDIANPKDAPEKQNADRAECMALMGKLQEKFGTLTIERLVSGKGIANIYEALLEIKGVEKPADDINAFSVLQKAQEEMTKKEAGLGPRSETPECLAMKAHDYFFTFLAAQAYNQAVSKKVDEIYFAGGVMADPVIQDMMLNHSPFFQSFLDKTPQIMNGYIRDIKMFIVTERDIAFQGAALLAKQELEKINTEQERTALAQIAQQDKDGLQTLAIVGALTKTPEGRQALLQTAADYNKKFPALIKGTTPIPTRAPLPTGVTYSPIEISKTTFQAEGSVTINMSELRTHLTTNGPEKMFKPVHIHGQKKVKHLDFTNIVVHTFKFREYA